MMSDEGLGPIHIDHIGIAAHTLEQGSAFWGLLGLVSEGEDEVNSKQGVTTRFFALAVSESKPPMLEILEPTSDDTPIGRFLAKRGPGIQQICLRVPDLVAMLEHLKANGIRLIDESPRSGTQGASIAFVHPKSTGGVLVELTQRP